MKEKAIIYLKKNWPAVVGIVIGMVGGYLYYFYVGCASGGCPIQSNPWFSTLWGGAMGYLLGDMFVKKEKKKDGEEEKTSSTENEK